MGLIVTDRHTPADLEAWRRLHEQDLRSETGSRVLARRQIRAWHDRHGPDGYVISCSWGKDSSVLLHLAILELGVENMPEVRYGISGTRNPDDALVRDAWLERVPQLRYSERVVRSLQQDLAPDVGHRVMHGVRAAESAARRRSAAVHGHMTERTCRPLLLWSTRQVFAYLAQHGLPVHPAYGYLTGVPDYDCVRDRDRIRVHNIGGAEGGPFRAAWERVYYPDLV